jgi:hypothetical protein
MNPTFIILYVLACLLVGTLGRGRLIGMIGFTLLGLLVHPVVALVVLVLTAPVSWKRRATQAFRPLREGERRPFFPASWRRRQRPEDAAEKKGETSP